MRLIDLHRHILPDVDDGALDLADAVVMARQAERDDGGGRRGRSAASAVSTTSSSATWNMVDTMDVVRAARPWDPTSGAPTGVVSSLDVAAVCATC